jgi:hypothetical protein
LGSSSRILRARVSALFLTRARRNPSQRIPDNIVESTNNQVRAATDQTVTLFITPSFLGSASDAATGGKRLLGDQNLSLKPARRSY